MESRRELWRWARLADRSTLWTGPVRRRWNRKEHVRLAAKALSAVDLEAVRSVSADAPKGGMNKFADFESWLVEAVRRFDQYELLGLPRDTRILDIGCGAG